MAKCVIILMAIALVLILLIFMFLPIYQIIKIDRDLDDMRMDNLFDSDLEEFYKQIDDGE